MGPRQTRPATLELVEHRGSLSRLRPITYRETSMLPAGQPKRMLGRD